jgi:hypothetical protein
MNAKRLIIELPLVLTLGMTSNPLIANDELDKALSGFENPAVNNELDDALDGFGSAAMPLEETAIVVVKFFWPQI